MTTAERFVKSSFLINPVCDILCRQFNRAGMPGPALLSAKGCDMNKLNLVSLKIIRWSGWLLLPLVMLFLLTGYIMDGRYGFGKLLDEKSALTFHRMLHLPLIVLVVAHVAPAVYLAFQRWGWIKQRT